MTLFSNKSDVSIHESSSATVPASVATSVYRNGVADEREGTSHALTLVCVALLLLILVIICVVAYKRR